MSGFLKRLKTLSVRYSTIVGFWPILAIAGLVFIFFWKVFLRGFVPLPTDFVVGTYYPWLDYKWGFPAGVPVKNPITTDVVSFTYPMRTYAVELLKKGQWPLWNPYILTGIPLLANFQSAPFSPTNLFYFVFDTLTAWSFQVVIQHFLVAFFTYILLRHWRLSKPSSVVGGFIFAFSGFNLIWSQWNAHVLSASFIPLFLFFQDKWFTGGGWKSGVGLSFTIFFQIISGYPQIVFYTFIASALYWVINFVKSRKWIIRSLIFVIFINLGVGLSSFQILPAKELLSESQRVVEPLEKSWAFLPWVKIITFIAPDYFGNHATQNYWGPTDYTTTTGFVGVVALFFATLAPTLIKKRKEVLFLFILLITSLFLSFQTPVSLVVWKSGIFGLQAASMHRALVLFVFSLSLLAGFGADLLYKEISKIRIIHLVFPFILFFVFGAYSLTCLILPDVVGLVGFSPPDRWKTVVSLRNLVFPSGIFLIICTGYILLKKKWMSQRVFLFFLTPFLIFELFRFGWKFTPFSPRKIVYPKTPVLDYLIGQGKPFRVTSSEVIPMNMKMAYRIESLEGYDAVYPLSIAKFIAVLNSEKPEATPQGRYATVTNLVSHFLNLTNTKYVVAVKKDSKGKSSISGNLPEIFKRGNRYSIAFEDKTTVILENSQVLPRAFMVYDWEVIEDELEAFKKLIDEKYPLRSKIILFKESNYKPSKVAGNNSVDFVKYSEQESLIRVKTEKDGLLFVSDLYYPGWKAYLDGGEVAILKADYTFRAVYIPEGEHELIMKYEPSSFHNGLKYSLFSFVALFTLSISISRFGKDSLLAYTSKIRNS